MRTSSIATYLTPGLTKPGPLLRGSDGLEGHSVSSPSPSLFLCHDYRLRLEFPPLSPIEKSWSRICVGVYFHNIISLGLQLWTTHGLHSIFQGPYFSFLRRTHLLHLVVQTGQYFALYLFIQTFTATSSAALTSTTSPVRPFSSNTYRKSHALSFQIQLVYYLLSICTIPAGGPPMHGENRIVL